MKDTILPLLESARKELLDLGMRNTLLNYKVPKVRGLHIIQEKSASIFDILVRNNKAMTFLGIPEKEADNEVHEEDELPELPELSEAELKEAHADTRLQTSETEKRLQTNILNTYYFARTSIEEQGVNILYLSLGMLNWYEAGNTQEPRTAPLILIPVSLDRTSAHERFRLRYTGSEIGGNLSLQAKMKAEFNIYIPDLPDAEELNIEQYFADVAERVAHQQQWKVDYDAIELGFFSFGKFMIYHDLDGEEWPEDKKPWNHPNINALFNVEGFREPQPTATDDHHLDNDIAADELFQVVDADSSQILAMLAVDEGRNLVIQGPPGTGKSQTITNIIGNAVGKGKKVLFVAEKMAALEVVKRRLDSIHLGEACLELHSHKANKRELHEELKRILDLGKPSLTHLQQEVALLKEHKDELNAYCEAINKNIAKSGLSAQKVIGSLLQVRSDTAGAELPKIAINHIEEFDADKMSRAEMQAERIQARLKETGTPAALLFWGSELLLLLPHEQEELKKHLDGAFKATEELRKYASQAALPLGLPVPQNETGTEELINTLRLAGRSPDLRELNVAHPAWRLNRQDILELLETVKSLKAVYHQYKGILIAEAWEQNIIEIRQNLLAYGDKWYRFLIGAYGKSNKQFAALCKGMPPKDVSEKLACLDAISEARRLERQITESETLGRQLFGMRWHRQKADWDALYEAASYLEEVHQLVAQGAVPGSLITYLARNVNAETATGYAQGLRELQIQQEKQSDALLEELKMNEEKQCEEYRLSTLCYEDQAALLWKWKERLSGIQQVIAWNNLAADIEPEFNFLLQASTHWPGAATHLRTALQKTWYEYLISMAMANDPALRKFERASHEEVAEKFRKLDLLNLRYTRARVALKHWEGVPRQESGGQVNILRGEFNRKARHMPIRRLMREAGLAIQAIKPVFMMSPMSIANFMVPGSIEFDLVIFDEASQVRPVEALGAAMRGKQLVVVGDTRQLPPTSFFDKMNTESEDEDNTMADMQSILGLCDAKGAPQRMLRWHYRSRHESLISLSNREFYENKLVIFPSPGSKQRLGLAYHHLPDAVYEKGQSKRSNPREAEAVADAVIRHAIQSPKESLGVVAFSTSQMQAIQTAIEIRRRKQPETEDFFGSHPEEPFFVKNLENVQGDERDVIFISIGYGRTEDGKVPMSFGPLNNEGGERRLNVLITRAKRRCEVFTNITSEDMRINENTKFGVRTLKSFLYFAQHGHFDVAKGMPEPEKRPFEDEIARQLEDAGHTVRKQVGSSAFYVDLVVVDPDHPGRYLLGIECDGSSYASARSARDRDRLRRQVLEAMGWRMHRVWSADWYLNPEREFNRLVAAIEKAKQQTELDDSIEEELQQELQALVREQTEEETVVPRVYQLAELSSEIGMCEFHLHPLGRLSTWLEAVVKVESPVHFDEVARRMVSAAGLAKVGIRIRETLFNACALARREGRIRIKGDFLWHPAMDVPVIRERSNLPATSRKIQYIAPEELSLAIKKVVEESIAIEANAIAPFVARLFGFSRVTEEMRNEILRAVEWSLSEGIVQRDGELLKV